MYIVQGRITKCLKRRQFLLTSRPWIEINSKIHLQDCEEFVDWFIDKAKENGCETGIFCGDWHSNRNTINVPNTRHNNKMFRKTRQGI